MKRREGEVRRKGGSGRRREWEGGGIGAGVACSNEPYLWGSGGGGA